MLYASSTIGIVAVGVALLMIGGEFDLSAGVSVVTSALVAALLTFQLTLNMWVGVLVSAARRAGDRVHQRLPGGPHRDPAS